MGCTMLEDYFDFLAPVDIRLKGTRIGIETILMDYLDRKMSPEAIQEKFPHLSLEQVYATILYYLNNKDDVTKYLDAYRDFRGRARQDGTYQPAPSRTELAARMAERDKALPQTA